jgi:ATP/ADP translocase
MADSPVPAIAPLSVESVDSRRWNSLTVLERVFGGISEADLRKVGWLSIVLAFLMCAYWLLCALKDPIMSTITGVRFLESIERFEGSQYILLRSHLQVEYIPRAKLVSVVVVLGVVLACKLKPFCTTMRSDPDR